MSKQISNTWNCNFKCDHCVHRSSSLRKDFVTKIDFMNFCESIKNMEVNSNYIPNEEEKLIYLSGGEPFNHPYILWQIETLLDYDYRDIIIVSNGVWTTKSIFKLFEMKFAYNPHLIFHISDTIYHRKNWKDGYTADYAIEKISKIGIRCEKRLLMDLVSIGRAKDNNLSSSNHSKSPCFFTGKHIFDPCLMPSGKIASCHLGKCIVGNSNDNILVLKQKFLKYMNKIDKNQFRINNCSNCKNNIEYEKDNF